MLSNAKLQNLKAIHNHKELRRKLTFVVINRKTTKFESNSQRWMLFGICQVSCYQSQNYKIWKQFTTELGLDGGELKLLSIPKLQNLKAIHNIGLPCRIFAIVVINRKTTKFESNSQHLGRDGEQRFRCYQSQNYKIWKQFTTTIIWSTNLYWLLSIAKLQNLKAIHNERVILFTKIIVVINRKTTKFESNSQQVSPVKLYHDGCYQSQNYKIWKQFTTRVIDNWDDTVLLSITKLRNLKAIHNRAGHSKTKNRIVINHKTTKLESNSQRVSHRKEKDLCCYQSQNYKIWKQFTTKVRLSTSIRLLLSIAKLQNLKAIHNS